MTRFFFDIVRESTCAHDFHGRYFRTLDEARDMAEAVSFDLACSENEDSVGSEIQVRDPWGALLFAVQVRSAETVFA
jgi:hypothetical protein